jgi:energy-coupling factor transporter ATP-binding protein EcfA2
VSNLRCSLAGLRVERLRGFGNIALSLEQPHLFLVGPNNAGKSSLLRMIDWAMNGADDALLRGDRRLCREELELLLPAADTHGRARRITLRLSLPDGRRHKRFLATNGIAHVRLKVKADRVSAHLGAPRRGEPDASDPRALELLRALREQHHFVYVPNARDAASSRFRDALVSQARLLLTEALTHTTNGRPGSLVTSTQTSITKLTSNAQSAVGALVGELTSQAHGLFDEATVDVALTAEAVIGLLANQTQVRLTTGKHDANMVPAHEVGSGLQSLLFVGLMRSASAIAGTEVVLLLEEPETFLHPAAQRELAQALLDSADLRFIASTHSAAMLDEASASDVVLLRDHRVFEPTALDPSRGDIDSAFMSGQGAEAVFARSVLLVEGPGDLAVFEQIRRRVARLPEMSRVASRLAVVQVGGCERFAPWVRLLRGYVDQNGNEAIAGFTLADGDAGKRLRAGLRDAKVTVPESVSQAIDSSDRTHGAHDEEAHVAAIADLNAAATEAGLRAGLLPFDLEYSLLVGAASNDVAAYAERFRESADSGLELAHRLGSTFRENRRQNPPKADWMRGHIAERAPFEHLDPQIRHVLREWIRPALDGLELPIEITS